MATSITTSPWTQLASHQIWNYGTSCYMYFQVFAYCSQDPINNKSTVYTRSRICVQNNNTGYTGYSVSQTWKCGMTGASDYSWTGTIKDGGKGVTSENILSNGSFTVNHSSDGSGSSRVYYWFQGSGVTSNVASSASPNYVDITLPKIDRTAGTPTISNVSATYNSASCNITVPFASTVNQYSRDGSNWTDWNKSVSANTAFSDTWSGLSPNTSYTFYYRFRRDYNQVWSSAVSFTVTTAKPASGNASNNITITTSSLTYNSVKLSFSGGSAGAGGSISYYRIKGLGYGDYTKVSNPCTITGLNPNTTYNFTVDFVDNYGTAASGSTSGSITTPKPSAPTKGTVSASSITYNGAKLSWSGFSFGSGATWGKYQYSWNNSSWNDCGQSTNLTFTDRSPNTTYNFYVRLVDNYGSVSSVASTSFTTSKPAAPTKGTVTVSNITESSAVFSWSGFSFDSGATWGYYRYSTNGSSWASCGTDTIATLTGLSPNTSYTFYVQLVDNSGTASSSATVTFTTGAEKAWKYSKYGMVYIKVDGAWKYGKLYYKQDGAWTYTDGNFIKQ